MNGRRLAKPVCAREVLCQCGPSVNGRRLAKPVCVWEVLCQCGPRMVAAVGDVLFNNNNNERTSRAPFHMKHAHLR